MSLRRASGLRFVPGLAMLLAAAGADAAHRARRRRAALVRSRRHAPRARPVRTRPIRRLYAQQSLSRRHRSRQREHRGRASRLPAGQGPVTRVRSGKQPRHGLRFVLDLSVLQRAAQFHRRRRTARPAIDWSSSSRTAAGDEDHGRELPRRRPAPAAPSRQLSRRLSQPMSAVKSVSTGCTRPRSRRSRSMRGTAARTPAPSAAPARMKSR